jgi:hypothetical protein
VTVSPPSGLSPALVTARFHAPASWPAEQSRTSITQLQIVLFALVRFHKSPNTTHLQIVSVIFVTVLAYFVNSSLKVNFHIALLQRGPCALDYLYYPWEM